VRPLRLLTALEESGHAEYTIIAVWEGLTVKRTDPIPQ
jgi:hypothetical protein